ncbi:MAG TPA: hypothetical protein VN924_27785 [Bryobacteraceae bacterium]|nr:hypothetical protein [Bryobacteraceae bacterium]
MDITADTYAYPAGFKMFSAIIPVQGKIIAEIAKLWGKDPFNTIFDLLIEHQAFTNVAIFMMSEPDVALAPEQPWILPTATVKALLTLCWMQRRGKGKVPRA